MIDSTHPGGLMRRRHARTVRPSAAHEHLDRSRARPVVRRLERLEDRCEGETVGHDRLEPNGARRRELERTRVLVFFLEPVVAPHERQRELARERRGDRRAPAARSFPRPTRCVLPDQPLQPLARAVPSRRPSRRPRRRPSAGSRRSPRSTTSSAPRSRARTSGAARVATAVTRPARRPCRLDDCLPDGPCAEHDHVLTAVHRDSVERVNGDRGAVEQRPLLVGDGSGQRVDVRARERRTVPRSLPARATPMCSSSLAEREATGSQKAQSPHPTIGMTATRSPRLTCSTPGPTAVTSPASSWPCGGRG